MNKPAPREPSMDEILSSIRQIIADDDAAAAPRKPSPTADVAAPPTTLHPAPALIPRVPTAAPVAPTQFLRPGVDTVTEQARATPANVVRFADVDARDPVPTGHATLAPEETVVEEPRRPVPIFGARTAPAATPPLVQMPPVPRLTPRPVPSVAAVAPVTPVPAPAPVARMAEAMLAPAADAAVKQTFARLNGLTMQGAGQSLEGLMRDMLRPMLKEWLDENLPSLVERMVEKEIARVSRGDE